jgi:hypothetical protein
VLERFAAPFDTLEAAARIGRLLIRTSAIAREIEVDKSGRVRGVVWINLQNRAAAACPRSRARADAASDGLSEQFCRGGVHRENM